jgi:antitoxin (DNA-binding transcriptional repressor) of toxin-antitoxin stability system
MIVTDTELASDSKAILDKVIQGEEVQVQRQGKPVAVIRPQVGWMSAEEMARDLNSFNWTEEERMAMRKAIADTAEVIGYAGCD